MLLDWLKKSIFLFSFFSISLCGECNYILCIDGGGSKTVLQVLDHEGCLVALLRGESSVEIIETSGSNINTVGREGVRAVLLSLFENVKIEKDLRDLVDILPNCQVVAGMAGLSDLNNKLTAISLFEEWGLDNDRICIMSDADLALQLLDSQGIVLISGTGSICLGKKEQTVFRVGGLGRILGDEGSGYQIGLMALKAALADEYSWDMPTTLTSSLRKFFNVAELKNLVPEINSGTMHPAKIASCAPIVFKEAWENDLVAAEIVHNAAKDLGHLLVTQLKMSTLSDCELHLWGGIFKTPCVDDFIQTMMDHTSIKEKKLTVMNQSHQNPAVLFARRFLPVIACKSRFLTDSK